MAAQAHTNTVTNIFKRVENVFVTNSVDRELLKEKCRIHEDRALDFVCVVCDWEICQLCKLSEHEGHETKSVALVADEVKVTLLSVFDGRIADYAQGLLSARQDTEQRVRVLEEETGRTKGKLTDRYARLLLLIGLDCPQACDRLAKAFEDRLQTTLREENTMRDQKGVARVVLGAGESMCAVRSRQATLRDMASAVLAGKLLALEAMQARARAELASGVTRVDSELADVSLLQERARTAVGGKNHVAILELNRHVASDFSAERTRAKLDRVSPAFTYTLQHHQASKEAGELEEIGEVFWSDRKDAVERYFHDVLGDPVETKSPADRPTAALTQVKLAFRFSGERQATAKFMCPVGEEKMMVSFSTTPNTFDGMTKTFLMADGRQVDSESSELCSLASFPNSRGGSAVYSVPIVCGVSESSAAEISVFAKFRKHYKLTVSDVESNCSLQFFKVHSDFLGVRFLALDEHIWTVSGMGTRSFDASSDGQMFAVVNAVQENTFNAYGVMDGIKFIRRVLVLRRTPDGGSLCRLHYDPPTPAKSSPMDVCFYVLGGEEVLLVADMGDDSIQVARQSGDGGSFVFDRFLVDHHPLLRCPTALNTDRQGRLWVACQGGNVLTVELA